MGNVGISYGLGYTDRDMALLTWGPCHRGMTQVKELAKSMLAAKSFNTTTQPAALQRWLGILAEELADRLLEDVAANTRRPRCLTLYYR